MPDNTDHEIFDYKLTYYRKMIEAEKIILSHLEDTLPSIDKIAKQLAISESTLKRHFKLMFGKGIYEYYLQHKMDHARNILLKSRVTVSEVAALLNYEKVSCFIDIFRKHYGIAPGALAKRSA